MIKFRLLITLFLLLIMPLSCSINTIKEQLITIKKVIDGDTFVYKDYHIRLLGVDTPESTIGYPSYQLTTGLEAWYALAAKNYVKEHIENKQVTFYYEKDDKYNRQVGKISYQDVDLGLDLIKNGLARVAYISDDPQDWYYYEDFEYYQKLLQAQYFAYQNEVGLWHDKESFKIIFPKAN